MYRVIHIKDEVKTMRTGMKRSSVRWRKTANVLAHLPPMLSKMHLTTEQV
jgi:hypothetical protein